jgi:hypothetical protein
MLILRSDANDEGRMKKYVVAIDIAIFVTFCI